MGQLLLKDAIGAVSVFVVLHCSWTFPKCLGTRLHLVSKLLVTLLLEYYSWSPPFAEVGITIRLASGNSSCVVFVICFWKPLSQVTVCLLILFMVCLLYDFIRFQKISVFGDPVSLFPPLGFLLPCLWLESFFFPRVITHWFDQQYLKDVPLCHSGAKVGIGYKRGSNHYCDLLVTALHVSAVLSAIPGRPACSS